MNYCTVSEAQYPLGQDPKKTVIHLKCFRVTLVSG